MPDTDTAADFEYTPVILSRGKVVHALTINGPHAQRGEAACGKKGKFKIALRMLNCIDCKLAVGLDARPKKKRRRG